MEVDPHGESGVRVALGSSGEKFLHVAAAPAGQTEQAGVVFERILDLVKGTARAAAPTAELQGRHHRAGWPSPALPAA